MTEIRLNISDVDFAHDEETRVARHELLASFLGAYVDGELPPETRSQMDAHLTGCARCRRELDIHRAVRSRLEKEPVPAASTVLRDRIAAGIRNAPPPVFAAELAADVAPKPNKRLSSRGRVVVGVASTSVVAAIVVSLIMTQPSRTSRGADAAPIAAAQTVPLVSAILSDYRRVTAGDTPGRARDLVAVRGAVPFGFNPLSGNGVRLLAAWTTSIAGEPAAVLAYRWNDRQILQYFVTDQLLFQSPAVRSSLVQQRAASATDGAQGMLLWAEPEYGTILIGDVSPEELATLRNAAQAR